MIPLLATAYDPPGALTERLVHEHVAGAVVHLYRVEAGQVLVTLWGGLVHEVIFQTPCELSADSEERNRKLFDYYGEGQTWSEILDNGFGKSYRRADMQRCALWSYAMDFNTFGTMAFHEVRWR
jgi:hypothetical protein